MSFTGTLAELALVRPRRDHAAGRQDRRARRRSTPTARPPDASPFATAPSSAPPAARSSANAPSTPSSASKRAASSSTPTLDPGEADGRPADRLAAHGGHAPRRRDRPPARRACRPYARVALLGGRPRDDVEATVLGYLGPGAARGGRHRRRGARRRYAPTSTRCCGPSAAARARRRRAWSTDRGAGTAAENRALSREHLNVKLKVDPASCKVAIPVATTEGQARWTTSSISFRCPTRSSRRSSAS